MSLSVRRGARTIGAALALLATGVIPRAAVGQQATDLDELEGVGITEHLDELLPLDAVFFDEEGQEVRLGSYFTPERPVLLNFVYFDCPMLCNLLVDGMVSTMQETAWTPGAEYEVVTVSIDPRDNPSKSTLERDHYLQKLDRTGAEKGWHFLTGKEESIHRLAEAIGFNYRYDAESREYLHAAAIYVATPEGRLSRYLYGVMFEPVTLRLALVEASAGKIGTAVDQFLLFCYAYDHTEGRYGPAAFKLLRLGGVMILVFLGAFFAMMWRREAVQKKVVSLGAHT